MDVSEDHKAGRWQKQRHWFMPVPQCLAKLFSPAASGRPATLHCHLAVAALTWLWQHRVSGRAIFPGAAMFEAAYQAAWVSSGKQAYLAVMYCLPSISATGSITPLTTLARQIICNVVQTYTL